MNTADEKEEHLLVDSENWETQDGGEKRRVSFYLIISLIKLCSKLVEVHK